MVNGELSKPNRIGRNITSIKGIMTIDTSAGKTGDSIHATREDGRWTLMQRGIKYQCFPDMLRRFVVITEAI
jgi:hypothetical protein